VTAASTTLESEVVERLPVWAGLLTRLLKLSRDSPPPIILELDTDIVQNLKIQYARLSAEANPRPLTWDEFKTTALMIGLDRLRGLPAEEALDRIDGLERYGTS